MMVEKSGGENPYLYSDEYTLTLTCTVQIKINMTNHSVT